MAEEQRPGRWNLRRVLNEGATKEWQERYPPLLRMRNVFNLMNAICPCNPNCDGQSEAYVFVKNYMKTIENGIFLMANDSDHYDRLILDKTRFFESRRNERMARRR